MTYVYLLRSQSSPNQTYIGRTVNIPARLKVHNQGGSKHTAKFRPWSLQTFLAFSVKQKAVEFERYLKSGSGRAFATKHL
ncbi:MAG: GIY-YIG nuclease family protein [Verrucomicrobia bacterium]|nr:GIY-YIG nuclease family protein [Verrucomicrobiota bacterium]